MSKKFINKPEDAVSQALQGVCLSNPDLAILKNQQTIILKTPVKKQVTLLCGGGSGHEPAHVGFVDPKMLHAAVCGGVFASPSYQQVLSGIQQIGQEQGVLVIIKNYTGDVINFELASGFARSQNGLNVKTLIVGDDIAFMKDSQDLEKRKEARGLSGTVLVYKILGGAASQGKNLEYIHSLGQKILPNMFSLGVSMSSCSLPGFKPSFHLESDEIEIGLGIHGEQGKGRQKIGQVREIVSQMLQENFYKFVKEGDKLVLLVNNLGSCTDIEMAIFEQEILMQLKQKNISVVRIVEGRIMTSLEMQGILVTLFKLEQEYEDEVLSYLDLEVQTKHWSIKKPLQSLDSIEIEPTISVDKSYSESKKSLNEQGSQFKNMLVKIFTELSQKEEYFNKLDGVVGDADCGTGLKRACTAVLENIDYLQFDSQFSKSMISLGEIIANSYGGTSGPLYGNFLSQGATKLKSNIEQNGQQEFQQAFQAGTQGVSDLGRAEVGERTMYDVLHAVSYSLSQQQEKNMETIVQIAQQAAEKTSQLPAKKGRARYLDGKEIGQKDPGCELVVEWLRLVQQNMNN